MKFLKLLPALAILFSLSCSTKTQKAHVQNKFTSGLDQMKPSKKNKVHEADFIKYVNEENFEVLLQENSAAFVVFGIVSNDYSDFEKKYGIKVKTENCVITPRISKIAALNNHLISEYLNAKFNNQWKSDLKILPFGLH